MATSRMAIPLPSGADPPDFAGTILPNLANRVDTVGAMYQQGTYNSRPATGKQGEFYWATDIGRFGTIYYYNGTAWKEVEPFIRVLSSANSTDPVAPGYPAAEQDHVEYKFGPAGAEHVWPLRYTATRTNHKWVAVGAAPLVYSTSTTVTRTTAPALIASPALQLPTPGDYLLRLSGSANDSPIDHINFWLRVHAGATDYLATTSVVFIATPPTSSANVFTGTAEILVSTAAPADVDIYADAPSAGQSYNVPRLTLTATPLALGT